MKKRIGIVDVDGHNYPNFALMRIAAYHKSLGDDVEMADAMFGGHYDIIYRSKIFTFTPDDMNPYDCDVEYRGGTGYDIHSQLPAEIEKSLKMDYSLYPQYPFSIQFFSRGCIRHCPFCLVRDKEGYIHSVDPVELNPKGKWIEIFDNNFFAAENWKESCKYLIDTNQPLHFHGVDVRILTEEMCYYLSKMKLKTTIHIAWDLPKLDLEPQLRNVAKWMNPNRFSVYCLIGFNSTKEEDIHRVRVIKDIGMHPFVQPYRNFEGTPRVPTKYETDFARWANRSQILQSCDFFDYEPRNGFFCKQHYTQEEIERIGCIDNGDTRKNDTSTKNSNQITL